MSCLASTSQHLEDGLAYALEPRLAAHYERHLLDECGYRSHLELAEQAFGVGANQGKWLDLGAGSGLVGRALAALGSSAELVAVDRSQAMLDLIDVALYGDDARLQGDCTGPLPLPPRSFAGVLAAGLLEHLVDPGALFDNACRLVRFGGSFLFTYPPNRTGHVAFADDAQGLVSHDVERLSARLQLSGFTIAAEREYPAYRNGAHGWMVHRLVSAVADAPTAFLARGST
jgi:SAM-dependent methyltransferase